jgi:hypothetical protein
MVQCTLYHYATVQSACHLERRLLSLLTDKRNGTEIDPKLHLRLQNDYSPRSFSRNSGPRTVQVSLLSIFNIVFVLN